MFDTPFKIINIIKPQQQRLKMLLIIKFPASYGPTYVTCDSLHDNRCKQTNPAGALNGAADQSTRNAD